MRRMQIANKHEMFIFSVIEKNIHSSVLRNLLVTCCAPKEFLNNLLFL